MPANPFFGRLFPEGFFPHRFFFDRYEVNPPPSGWGGAGTYTISRRRKKPKVEDAPRFVDRQAESQRRPLPRKRRLNVQ